MQGYLTIFKGPAFSNLIHATSRRKFQNMSLSCADNAVSLANRKNFLEGLDIDYRDLVCAKQVHGSRVRYVSGKDRGRGAFSVATALADTDALMTEEKKIPLAILTADCLPVFIYDAKTPAVALVHAGWRGSCQGITTKAIAMMKDKFHTQARSLYMGFSPAIRECCYEVGGEFQDYFSHGLVKKGRRYYLDLAAINKTQALDSGLRETNIFDAHICTACNNSDFFSFRKEGINCGRSMSVAMLA